MEVGTSTVSDSSPETGSSFTLSATRDATFTYFSAFSPCCRPDLADPPKGIDIEKVDGGLEITAEGPGSCQITISSTDVESSILPVAVYMKPGDIGGFAEYGESRGRRDSHASAATVTE